MGTMLKKVRSSFYRVLRYSERYVKTDMIYLVKGGSWLSFGYIATVISGLALSVGFANLVPKEVFGNYKFIISIAGILGAFSLTGMGLAITQAVARGYEGSFKTCSLIHLKWGAFITLASIGGSSYYFLNQNGTLALSLLIIGIFLPVLLSSTLYGNYLSGKKDFRTSGILSVLRTTLSAGALLITIFLTQNVIIIILVYYVSITLLSLASFFITNKKYPSIRTNIDPDTITFGKHLSLMGILSGVAAHIDKILIFHFLGATQLAVYAFAIAIPDQLKQPAKIMATLALPKLSQQSIPELKKTIHTKAIMVFVVVILVAIIYVLTAPYIYKLLFPQYTESIFYSQLYAVILLFIPTGLYLQTLIAHMKKEVLYIVNLTNSVTKIGLLIILLPTYGILGAITSLIGAQILTSLILLIFFKFPKLLQQ